MTGRRRRRGPAEDRRRCRRDGVIRACAHRQETAIVRKALRERRRDRNVRASLRLRLVGFWSEAFLGGPGNQAGRAHHASIDQNPLAVAGTRSPEEDDIDDAKSQATFGHTSRVPSSRAALPWLARPCGSSGICWAISLPRSAACEVLNHCPMRLVPKGCGETCR